MAASPVNYRKIPLGDLTAPVTAEILDRMQQRIQEMAQSIPVPSPPNVVTVSSDYSVKGTEDVLHVNSQAGPIRVTLLQPSSSNRPITVKQVNLQSGKSKVNQVTVVTPDGSPVIAGAPSYALDTTGTGSVSFTADDQQHWPNASAGGNPPISPTPTPVPPFVPPVPPVPPPPVITPWVAPVPYGNQNTFISNNTAGAENWSAECMVDFTNAPGTVTAYLWLEGEDTGASGIVRVRIGTGGYKSIADPVFVEVNVTASTMTPLPPTSLPISPPSGQNRVTLTLQSTNTNKTTITGVNLLFR